MTYFAPIMLLSKPMVCRLRLKCDGTRAETRFRLSAKRSNPFKSTTGSRAVHISGNNAGYTMFRGTVKGTGCPLQSPSPSLPLPCITVSIIFQLDFTIRAYFCDLLSEGVGRIWVFQTMGLTPCNPVECSHYKQTNQLHGTGSFLRS